MLNHLSLNAFVNADPNLNQEQTFDEILLPLLPRLQPAAYQS